MHMRFRIVDTSTGDARPVACAGQRQDAYDFAETLSRKPGNVVTVIDYGDYESPEPLATYQGGKCTRRF